MIQLYQEPVNPPLVAPNGRMAELVDAIDSKSVGRKVVRVQVPLCPPNH